MKKQRIAIDFAHKQTEQNVLVISGAVGNGSTHLALAILNEIELLFPKETVFYSSFENIQYWIRTNQKKELLNPDFFNSHFAILIDGYNDNIWQNESEKLFQSLKM